MSALVTPGSLRSALALTRSLGRRGVEVTTPEVGVSKLLEIRGAIGRRGGRPGSHA